MQRLQCLFERTKDTRSVMYGGGLWGSKGAHVTRVGSGAVGKPEGSRVCWYIHSHKHSYTLPDMKVRDDRLQLSCNPSYAHSWVGQDQGLQRSFVTFVT